MAPERFSQAAVSVSSKTRWRWSTPLAAISLRMKSSMPASLTDSPDRFTEKVTSTPARCSSASRAMALDTITRSTWRMSPNCSAVGMKLPGP